MKYRPEIDGLRAVAVLPVLFFHAGFSWVPGGFAGVDVFFVISGYLIARVIDDELKAGTFTFLGFYERRFRRISPALAVMCIATIPFAWLWMVPQELDAYGQSLATANLSVSNFLFWKRAGYFDDSSALKPLIHTWSLGVEEQFYLVFPMLLWALRRRGSAFPVVAALVAVSFALTFVFARFGPAANFYLLPTRFWELGAGALLALWRPTGSPVGRVAAEVLSMTGLALVIGSIFLLNGSVPYPGPWTLAPVVGSGLIIAMANAETMVGRLLAWRPLVFIGLISYSLYLWHQPLFAFARMRLFGDVSTTVYLSLIALTLLLACVTWWYVEQPFRNRQRFTRGRFFLLLGTVAAALVAFGVAADKTSGLPMRGTDRQLAVSLKERMRPNTGLGDDCDGRLPLSSTCSTSKAPTMIVWGDSFAMQLVGGIMASNPDAAIVQFTKSACWSLLDASPTSLDFPGDCQAFNDNAKAYIAKTKSLRFAVLSSTYGYVRDQTVRFQGEVIPSSEEFGRGQLQATLDWLTAQGITPILVSPAPSDGRDIGACLARSRWLDEDGEKCTPFSADVRKAGANVRTMLKSFRDRYKVIILDDFLCGDRFCKVQDGDVMIYRDGAHLSYEGSRYLGRTMHLYDQIVAPR
ncbi:acyltransferase family protein [Mesorhizobium sp. INR15]|uniref:acyltransferase family protein n=1 Tax=Mesorhizobium sp. INR15 TaxID=2654248 RepID=UPI00189696AD|nr:acyltransferase family protein [Mesorhizobium sp. INR15]QPC90849.1 acyltransferase family protein [Mesorhizobium sp. INR15]